MCYLVVCASYFALRAITSKHVNFVYYGDDGYVSDETEMGSQHYKGDDNNLQTPVQRLQQQKTGGTPKPSIVSSSFWLNSGISTSLSVAVYKKSN